jgi:hypothetical protein
LRLFVGDDWAEDHHDVELMDVAGRVLAKARLPEGIAGMTRLHAMVAEQLGDAGPAAEKRRSRSRLGSQARAGPSRAGICIQAVSSQAIATSSHQTWFWSKPCSGWLRSPGLGRADPVLTAGPAAVP